MSLPDNTNALPSPSPSGESALLIPAVGQKCRLTFENSAEGDVECEGCPLVVEAVCTNSEPDYLCFETEYEDGSAEGYEFFRHDLCRNDEHRGKWWDENLWTQLVR